MYCFNNKKSFFLCNPLANQNFSAIFFLSCCTFISFYKKIPCFSCIITLFFPKIWYYIYINVSHHVPQLFFLSIIQYVKENEWTTPTKIIWWKYISIYIYTINHAHPSGNQFVISSLNNSIAYSPENNMAVSKEEKKKTFDLFDRAPADREKKEMSRWTTKTHKK